MGKFITKLVIGAVSGLLTIGGSFCPGNPFTVKVEASVLTQEQQAAALQAQQDLALQAQQAAALQAQQALALQAQQEQAYQAQVLSNLQIQQELNELGYPCPVTGILDGQTRTAFYQFYVDYMYVVNGVISLVATVAA